MSEGLGIQGFLNEDAGGGRGGYLKWKEDGEIKVWLHRHTAIPKLWHHSWMRRSR
ncbi:MAG: hypothetical protein HC945_03485 [Nitrosarchaeum sp.]|nr:hypothetical protein [Nitrosarchaeum sp.]